MGFWTVPFFRKNIPAGRYSPSRNEILGNKIYGYGSKFQEPQILVMFSLSLVLIIQLLGYPILTHTHMFTFLLSSMNLHVFCFSGKTLMRDHVLLPAHSLASHQEHFASCVWKFKLRGWRVATSDSFKTQEKKYVIGPPTPPPPPQICEQLLSKRKRKKHKKPLLAPTPPQIC